MSAGEVIWFIGGLAIYSAWMFWPVIGWKILWALLKDIVTLGGKLNGAYARHGCQTYLQCTKRN